MIRETKDIATRLRKCIEESRFTYAELEKKTGIAKSSIQRYASGVTKKIPIDAIQSIARALGVAPEYIIGWESSNPIGMQEQTPSPTVTEDDLKVALFGGSGASLR